MAALVDEGTLAAYRLFAGSIYHVACGEKAEYKEGPSLSGEDRWTCKTCDADTSPWTTDFTINRAKERGLMLVTNTWVLLDKDDLAEQVLKLDLHQATKDAQENTHYYMREATQQEKVQWHHKGLLEMAAREKAKEKG